MWIILKRTNSSGIWERLRRTSNWADTPICLKSRSESKRKSSSIRKSSMNCGTSPTLIISMRHQQRPNPRRIKTKSVFMISLCTIPFSNLYTVNNSSKTSSKTTHLNSKRLLIPSTRSASSTKNLNYRNLRLASNYICLM